jgi:hypothetical protein
MMSLAMKEARADWRGAIAQLKQYGSLQDILHSNASAEFKAACAEMGNGRLRF